jgi:hypothetical protein
MPRYLLATTLAALLEASSSQNDNLIMCVRALGLYLHRLLTLSIRSPLYMWSMVSLLGV